MMAQPVSALDAQQVWAGPPTSPVCGFWLPELASVHFCAYGAADGAVVLQQLKVRRAGAARQRRVGLPRSVPAYIGHSFLGSAVLAMACGSPVAHGRPRWQVPTVPHELRPGP